MKIHQFSPDEALDSLKSGHDGLSQAEALRRLSEYGPNWIDKVLRKPPRAYQERFLNGPLLVRAYLFLGVLEAAAAMAAYSFVLHEGGWSWGAGEIGGQCC